MKKLSFIFLFVFGYQFFVVSYKPKLVWAQNFNYQKAYSDYVFALDTYKREHADYLLARGQYLQANTLASQTKAKDETEQMLIARDEVIATYLLALRMKLFESQGVKQSEKDALFTRVDSEIEWYRNHKNIINSAGTLEDLIIASEESFEHFTINSTPLFYEVLSTIPIGEIDLLRRKGTDLSSLLKTKMQQIEIEDQNADLKTMTQWLTETENKLTRALDKQVEAQNTILQIQSPDPRKKIDYASLYNTIVVRSQESSQFVRESIDFMNEIIRLINAI